MRTLHLPKVHLPLLPYSWLLLAGEIGVFALCIAMLAAYFAIF